MCASADVVVNGKRVYILLGFNGNTLEIGNATPNLITDESASYRRHYARQDYDEDPWGLEGDVSVDRRRMAEFLDGAFSKEDLIEMLLSFVDEGKED